MLQIEFKPLNHTAEQIFLQAKTCRSLIERSMPSECLEAWGKHPFSITQPDARLVGLAERAIGPLSPTTKACLRGPQPISYHLKNGRLILRLRQQEPELAEAIGRKFTDVLVASSFGQGRWELDYSVLPAPSLKLANHEAEFLLARLDLPVPEGVLLDEIADAEPYVAQAILAEQINQAFLADDPADALHYLEPARLFVRCERGEVQHSNERDHGLRLHAFTGVRLVANVTTEGYVSIGRSVTHGHGMLFKPQDLS
jgi:hypothetical protein